MGSYLNDLLLNEQISGENGVFPLLRLLDPCLAIHDEHCVFYGAI